MNASNQKSPPTKAEMLQEIRRERQRFETLLEPFSEDRLTAPGVQGTWSIKDMLAHVAAWERLTLDRLHAARTGESLRIPPIKTEAQIDAMNARIYAENKDRPLKAVKAEFQAAHHELVAQIKALDEAFFQGPIPAAWGEGRPVWMLIGANTCWHYPEHCEAIEKGGV